MNKSELINALAKNMTLTRAQIKQVVDQTFDYISESLEKGDKFQVIGFGTFEVKRRTARTKTANRNNEFETINYPVFSPGKKLVDNINRKK